MSLICTHTHTRIQSQNSQEKPNLCVVPLNFYYYYFYFFLGVIGNIDSCRCKCHSAQQSSRNVFGNSYVCAYSHLFSFVSFILLGASMVTQEDIKVFKFNILCQQKPKFTLATFTYDYQDLSSPLMNYLTTI